MRLITSIGVSALALAAGVTSVSCMGRATPTERWYVDGHDRVYDVVLEVVRNLGGKVEVESRMTRSITARFPEEVFGYGIYLDVFIERREDESTVRAEARPESSRVERDDVDLLLDRFYEALDEACARHGVESGHGGGGSLQPPREPGSARPPGGG
jgi:hypothetical protein